ncbi:MAG: endonuclease/exonuclease/phosphatase family protein, partial [Bacteroidota bacterium]
TFQYDASNIDKVALLLNQEHPDVICLQEFRNHKLPDGSFALDHLANALGLPHYRFVHLPVHIHGAAIYSRYPIVQLDTLFMPAKEINSGILITVESPLGKVAVGNLHLSSFMVKKTWDEAEGVRAKLTALYKQARTTIALQHQKVGTVLEKTADFHYPLVLTGDMNAVPHSRISFRYRDRFQDAFLTGNNGLGWTFPILKITGLRIDYHYFSDPLTVTRFKILRSDISDHYPVVVDYMLDL